MDSRDQLMPLDSWAVAQFLRAVAWRVHLGILSVGHVAGMQ